MFVHQYSIHLYFGQQGFWLFSQTLSLVEQSYAETATVRQQHAVSGAVSE